MLRELTKKERNVKAVIAIGGNALIEHGGAGDIPEQFSRSRAMAAPLADLVERGWQVTVTHGNGPQVGSEMRRVELSSGQVYPIDLGLAVADTQGWMGYMIAQTWQNELRRRGLQRTCAAIITTVLVDPNDPGFSDPSKPIGDFMTEEIAKAREEKDGWRIVEDSGRGYRRVVASPQPLTINELPLIRQLALAGELIVAGGGGGIPVVEGESGRLDGVEAVIDKDLTSAIIAAACESDVLALVTGVEHVFVDFGKPTQRPLKDVGLDEVRKHIQDKQFPPGSMLPKVQAAVRFLEQSPRNDARVVITDLFNLPQALAGETGTTIRK